MFIKTRLNGLTPLSDDAMAILMAANSPEVQLLGITTVYGNVPTKLATQNALRLLEMAGLSAVRTGLLGVQGGQGYESRKAVGEGVGQ